MRRSLTALGMAPSMPLDGSLIGLKREFGAVSFSEETYAEAAPATVSDTPFLWATERHHATGKSGKATRGDLSQARRPAIVDVFVNISDGVRR